MLEERRLDHVALADADTAGRDERIRLDLEAEHRFAQGLGIVMNDAREHRDRVRDDCRRNRSGDRHAWAVGELHGREHRHRVGVGRAGPGALGGSSGNAQ